MFQLFYKNIRLLFALLFLGMLAGCGGGGGNPGTTSTSTSTGSTGSTSSSNLVLSLTDIAGTSVTNVAATGSFFVNAVVKDSAGAVVPFKLVTFATDASVATLVQKSVLTNSLGIASVEIKSASLTNSAGTVSVASGTATATLDYSVSAATTPPTSAATPTMTVSFVEVTNNTETQITNRALSQTKTQYLKVILKKSSGAVAPYERVSITLDDATKAVLVPNVSTQLTDETGLLKARVAPSTVSSTGAVTATITATVEGTSLTQTYNLNSTPGVVGFSAAPVVSTAELQKGQSLNVSVLATVDGAVPASNSVAVTFSSSCGTVSPASALVDNTGKASAVIQTTATGNCTVNASTATGVTSLATGYKVNSAPITGIKFESANPEKINQSGSPGGNTSIVTFKVIDSNGTGVQGENVTASLTNDDGGINFCGAPQTVASDKDGIVQFSVCGGVLPTNVQVKAVLDSKVAVNTTSNVLTVQTGLPTQRFFDIAASSLNFYAGGIFTSKLNGNSTSISVFLADRLGNPVPDGTSVVFVSEGGQIISSGKSSCQISNGRCSVTLVGQDYRPLGSKAASGDKRPGRVTVLAFADGEESFTDVDGNNRFTTGEPYEDLGTLFIDNDEDGNRTSSYLDEQNSTSQSEQLYPVPSGSSGDKVCNSNTKLSVAGTCNQAWNSNTKVRRSIVIVFSGGEIGQPSEYDATIPADKRTQVISKSTSRVKVRLADLDGNPLPSDTSIAASTIPTSNTTCIPTLVGTTVGNTTEPTVHTASLAGCSSNSPTIRFTATVSGKVSVFDVPLYISVTAGPSVTPATTSATASVTVDSAATGYYIAKIATDPEPTVQELKSTSPISMTANNPSAINLPSLTTATDYIFYFYAEETGTNLPTDILRRSFKTD